MIKLEVKFPTKQVTIFIRWSFLNFVSREKLSVLDIVCWNFIQFSSFVVLSGVALEFYIVQIHLTCCCHSLNTWTSQLAAYGFFSGSPLFKKSILRTRKVLSIESTRWQHGCCSYYPSVSTRCCYIHRSLVKYVVGESRKKFTRLVYSFFYHFRTL